MRSKLFGNVPREGRQKSRLFKLVIVLLLLFPPNAFGSPRKATTEIQYGSLQVASGSYAYCVAMSQLINKKVPDINITVIETGGAIEDLRLLYRGDVDMGLASFDSEVRAWKGIWEFKGNPNHNLRLLWPNFRVVHNYIVSKESGIKSFYDLDGKNFHGGGIGTSTEVISKAIFGTLGIHPKWFVSGVALARDSMKNRQIDGLAKSGLPDPSVMEISTAFPIKWLEISEDDAAKVEAKYPGMFNLGYIPANSYGKGMPPKDIRSYITILNDFASSRMSQDVVYKMAKVIYENKDYIGQAYPLSVESLAEFPSPYVETVPAPLLLHAGVVQLCKELGVAVPARVIPPEYKE